MRANLLSGELVGSGETQRQDAFWSVGLIAIGGVAVRLHFTFLLLLAWLGYEFTQGPTAIEGALFILGVVLSIAIHDLGHVLGAWLNGTPVNEIVAYPMGGISSFRRMPRPDEELTIALLGPLFSAAVALAVFILCETAGSIHALSELSLRGGDWWEKLIFVNVILAVGNLTPAFPMDGGRVLRALLARRAGLARASHVATVLGQGLSMLIGLAALLFQPFLLFVAMFAFLGAIAEADVYEHGTMAEGVPVEDAMMTDFASLSPADTLQKACDALLRGSQEDFPVEFDRVLVGYLTRDALLHGLAKEGRQGYVAATMLRGLEGVLPSSDLTDAVEMMRRDGLASLPVVDADRVVGVISLRNIAEYFALRRQGDRFLEG